MSASSRTLLLWRHAKSAWNDPALADIDRPLAPRGAAAAPRMAVWIGEQWQPDRAVCSPAKRTVQTLEYFTAAAAVPVGYDHRIYEAAWADLLAVVRETPPSVRTLMLVGHNPGFADLTAALAGPLPGKFPTAACAALSIVGDWRGLAPGGASLAAFQRPKALPKGY